MLNFQKNGSVEPPYSYIVIFRGVVFAKSSGFSLHGSCIITTVVYRFNLKKLPAKFMSLKT